MSDDLTIRLADPDRDADAVAGIYRPAVDVSSATFEEGCARRRRDGEQDAGDPGAHAVARGRAR